MVGPNRPRIPNLLAGNVGPLMGGFGGRPGLPHPVCLSAILPDFSYTKLVTISYTKLTWLIV
jgi:hypothetical protein